jgi:hypothetical protein
MSDLGAYLTLAMRTPWAWSTHDCCTFIANWSIERGRSDPMAFIRGHYRTERGALKAIKRGGGLLKLVSRGMASAGVPRVDDGPEPGDVAVIEIKTEDRLNEACAIWTGHRWAALGVRGITCGPAHALAVWRP